VSHQLTTPCRQSASPLVGFVCLSESYDDGAAAPIGLAQDPLCRYRVGIPKYPSGSTLRYPPHRRPCICEDTGLILPQAYRPSRVSPMRHHDCRPKTLSFLPRFCPLRRFPSRGEPLGSGKRPCLPVVLRPQGFAPSRRLAPATTCRAYFIPVPSMGFPYGVFASLKCRTSSRTPPPSRRWLAASSSLRPQGLVHSKATLRGSEV